MTANSTYILGLTGGIACGKSTVAAWLRQRGAVHLDADQVARAVVEPGTAGLAAILAKFGEHLAQADGQLDRKALGVIVFADPVMRRRLEVIVHPLIREALQRAVELERHNGTPLVLLDAALLFDMGLQTLCHATLTIEAQPATQVARLALRDHLSPAAAQQRLDAQQTSAERRGRATWAIDNDGGLAELEQTLEQWWPQLLVAQNSLRSVS